MMKKIKLFPKIFIYTFSIILFLIILTHIIIYYSFQIIYLENKKEEIKRTANKLSENIADFEKNEIYNSLKSSRAKYFIGVTSQRIIDEISKYEDRKEILYYLEEMNNYDEIENFLKKDVVLEIEEKTEKENIEIKERIKKLPLKNIERLDNEKKNQVNELVQKIEEILKEMK